MRCIPDCVTIVQKALLNNYKILSTLRKKGEQFSLLYLEELCFSFRHLTAVTNQEGRLKRHCFNESYILTDQAVILLND